MSTISSDGRTIEHSPGEKAALLRLSYHVISDQESGFGSHEARMILHLLARYSRSIRSRPIEDGERAWLVEMVLDNRPWWWAIGLPDEENWTTDPHKALRFSRKADADAFIGDMGWTEVISTEHEWSAPSNPGTSKVQNSRST